MKYSKGCLIWVLLLISAVANLSSTEAARILGIFPFPAKSHFAFNNAVLKSLADAGHEVTVITSFPQDVTLENYTLIDTSEDFDIQVANTIYNEFSNLSAYSISNVAFNHEKPTCYKFWQRKEIQDIINSKEKLFDIVFTEIFLLYKCFLPVAQKLGVPVIGTMTYRSFISADSAIGNPNNPTYIPYEWSTSWKPEDFFSRLWNTWNHCISLYHRYTVIFPFLENFHRDHLQQIIPYSTYMELEPSLIFYNTHHTYISRPMNKNAVEVAGIHIKPAKPLPQNIKEFIESAPHGVILFTLGSLVKTATLPTKFLTSLLESFAEIPQRVIMKYENPLDAPDNVLVLQWLPQRDILEHENVIAFITHCGQGGVYEAIYTATPIISCPLMFDQPSNAALLERSGVAVHLNIESASKHQILQALNEIVNDTRYRDNMKTLSDVFRNRPMSPQQSVVYWTEYVIKFQGTYFLKSSLSSLNWFQYLSLDIIGFLTLLPTITLIFAIYLKKLLHGRKLDIISNNIVDHKKKLSLK